MASRRQKRSRAGRVAIVGRPNVGKSTLLNALLGEKIAITSHHPQTTRDQILGVVTRDKDQVAFIDTPGLHAPRNKLGARMNALAKDAAESADLVVFLVEAPPSPADLALLPELPKNVPVVLALNKIDRFKAKHDLLPVLEQAAKLGEFAAIVPVSALKKDGTEHLVKALIELLPEGEPLYEEDALSDKPVRFFVAEFVREQILKKTRQEVPHGVAVVVERFDEGHEVPHIDLAIHVDRESHKKILIGSKGAMLKSIGIDARKRVEKLLGKQVHLQLWVRVTPGWAEDEARLRDLGYAGEGS
jgi:GTP-binding protein Era